MNTWTQRIVVRNPGMFEPKFFNVAIDASARKQARQLASQRYDRKLVALGFTKRAASTPASQP